MPSPGRRVIHEFDRFTVDASQRLLFSAGQTAPVDIAACVRGDDARVLVGSVANAGDPLI